MIKFNVLLLAAVVVSCVFLVNMQYEGRKLSHSILGERELQIELDSEHKNLRLARQNLTTPAQIERNARSALQMHMASLGDTEYIPRDRQSLLGFEPQVPANVRLIEQDSGQEGAADE